MNRAVFLTAFNRPDLLKRTLDSWSRVREAAGWDFIIRIEPGYMQDEVIEIAADFAEDADADFETIQVMVNDETYGVLHHPWVGFEDLFKTHDFVLRAEDDLLVSDDILRFFTWASEHYDDEKELVSIHGYTDEEPGQDPEDTAVLEQFSPWIWGTWKDRWVKWFRDTWDHDYSTFNGSPGNESGWDWNIDTRIFPANGLTALYPRSSRVQNIGVWGVHGNPENFREATSFRESYGTPIYRGA